MMGKKKCAVCGKEYFFSEDQRRPICGSTECKMEYTKVFRELYGNKRVRKYKEGEK